MPATRLVDAAPDGAAWQWHDVGISGLVVEYVVAIYATWVWFPAEAIVFPRIANMRTAQARLHKTATAVRCTMCP